MFHYKFSIHLLYYKQSVATLSVCAKWSCISCVFASFVMKHTHTHRVKHNNNNNNKEMFTMVDPHCWLPVQNEKTKEFLPVKCIVQYTCLQSMRNK